MKYYIAIPTYNGGNLWHKSASAIKNNIDKDTLVYVIDSNRTDNTVCIANDCGFVVESIKSNEFNHGGTRNKAINDHIDNYDVVIFLTQDAIPEAGFIEKILNVFKDEDVACAYGRQLPHDDANPLAQHARFYNYPEQAYKCGVNDIPVMGLKAAFMSNSFSAYRLTVFKELGGFPSDTILCEDMFYTAKAILAGYKVAYVSNAIVKHSHNYTPVEEFKRYFDIGVFQKEQSWIRDKFGGAGGEGKKYILSELNFLAKKYPSWIIMAFLNNGMKILGYKLGQSYNILPRKIVKKLSMHKRYWK